MREDSVILDDAAALAARKWLERMEELGAAHLRFGVRTPGPHDTAHLVRLLVERAAERRMSAPVEALAYAEMAVTVAGRTEGSGAAAWRASAHAELGNALRVLERYPEAEASFRVTQALLPEVQAPEQRAEIFSLLASLHADQRRFEKSRAALEEALRLARATGNQRTVTRLLVILAGVLIDAGDFGRAKTAVADAGDYLEQDPWDPLLVVMAMGNGIYATIEEAGQTKDPGKRLSLLDQALVMAEDAEPMFERHARPQERLQLQWYTGRLLVHEGMLGAAERKLEGLLDGFLDLERPISAADAAMDLCLVYARQGQAAELHELAGTCCRLFQGMDLSADMLAAFRLLRTAEDLVDAELLIIDTLIKRGAPLFGAPRASRGMNP